MSAKRHRIHFLLQQAAHRVKKEADRVLLEAGGLTTAQAAVLVLLSTVDHMPQKEIARQLRLNESGMTAMVARLLDNGWIERTRDPEDGRTRLISLRRAGRKALGRVEEPFARINAVIDASLGSTRTAALAQDLKTLIEAFDGAASARRASRSRSR